MMFQSVVEFFRNFFTTISNPRKRQRGDDSLDLYNEDFSKEKKIRMTSESDSDYIYFSNPFQKRTRETFSQTNEIIDLDAPTITTISLLDDNSSVSDKENVIQARTSSTNKSPKNKSFRAPFHCRSPHKIKFKQISHRRGSDDVQYVGTFLKDSANNGDMFSSNSSSKHFSKKNGSSLKKSFVCPRTEQIMDNALKSSDSFRSSAIYDFQSRMKYGELLGKVLKSPEMFSCSNRKATNPKLSSNIIDLTRTELSSPKSQADLSFKTLSKSPSAIVDLTSPSKKTDKSAEIINIDEGDSTSTLGMFAHHRRIVSPVNSLSKKLKHIPCTNVDYVSQLVAEIEILKKDFVKDKEHVSKELSAMSPLRHTFEKALEKRLRRHLKITSVDLDLDEDDEEAEPVKPQLTDQMISMVMNAWEPRKPKGQVLVNNFNYQIKRADLLTLSGLNWLNDEVINFYMELISARGKEKDFPSVHTFNTFFYLKLEKDGHAGLRRWTRKVDIFSFDFIIVPIHLSVHWCLAVINFKKKNITYFDSMGQANNNCVNALLRYLTDEHLDKKKETFDASKWKLICTKDTVPQQMNSCDCGVFACTFAEYFSREAKFQFSQEDMPYFRRKMTYEILSSRLLPWN